MDARKEVTCLQMDSRKEVTCLLIDTKEGSNIFGELREGINTSIEEFQERSNMSADG
jgi:hypothetical protein